MSLLVPILVRPISGRSGTTLVMHLLATSPSIAFERVYPYERQYLTYLTERIDGMFPEPAPRRLRDRAVRSARRRLGNLLRRLFPPGPVKGYEPLPYDPGIFDPATFVRLSVRRQWEAFSEAVVRHAGSTEPRYYAEKGNRLDLSKVDLPLKLLWLVRDPRDVWASIHAFDEQRGFYGFGRGRWQSRSSYMDEFVELAVRFTEQEAARSDREDDLFLRYEDLVLDPHGQTKRLEEWLDLELDPEAAFRSRPRFEHHMTSPSPEDSIGRWRTDLRPEEREILTERLAGVLERYGYHAELPD